MRWSAPTKYDQLPYGTVIGKINKQREGELTPSILVYIQMSKDDSFPCWEKIGIFSSDHQDLIKEEVNKILSLKQVR